MKTTMPKETGAQRRWIVIDAAGQPLGRLATFVADRLRGKDQPTFTPHMDTGAFVIVTNASQVKLTGRKESAKMYDDYSGYPSGLKKTPAGRMRARHPDRMITRAVWGMIPKNRLGRSIIRRLKVYPGAEHPHAAQQPEAVEFKA